MAQPLSKDIAARIEAIPIQTLTISDEQFLKGDAYGKPTTIAGVLRVAQGSGRLPVVIFIAGSSGFGPVSDVWDRQFEEMGISTFAMDSFAGRVIVSTALMMACRASSSNARRSSRASLPAIGFAKPTAAYPA
jgi:hypothetical protein